MLNASFWSKTGTEPLPINFEPKYPKQNDGVIVLWNFFKDKDLVYLYTRTYGSMKDPFLIQLRLYKDRERATVKYDRNMMYPDMLYKFQVDDQWYGLIYRQQDNTVEHYIGEFYT